MARHFSKQLFIVYKGIFFFLFFRVCGVLTKEAELLNPAETFLAEQRGGDAPRFAPVVTFNWEMGISGWSLKLQING